MVQSANTVLQQDELHDVADLLKVHLSDQHVDGVGGGEDDGEEEEADGVTSHRVPALAAWGGEATTPETLFCRSLGGILGLLAMGRRVA